MWRGSGQLDPKRGRPPPSSLEVAAATPPRARPPSGEATWVWRWPNPKLGGGSRRNTPGSTPLGESHLGGGSHRSTSGLIPSRGEPRGLGELPDPKLGGGSRCNTPGSTPLGESHVGLRAASSL
uniref:p0460E08.17 protein n=1 Tax=Oryza sativa subsp. japonica TaxID=39947 RepID=Q94DT0_ORYSJ|nr:P0460E08.17 [Oryza sativa Japonica Group]